MKKGIWFTLVIALVWFQSCGQSKSAGSTSKSNTTNFIDLSEVYDTARSLNNIRCLLISQNDKLIAGEYFKSYDSDSLDHLRSATKSVMSTLIGIAIDQGYIKGVDESISNYLGEKAMGKEAITIKHLLTMTSGLKWSEGAGYNDNNKMMDSGNPVDFVLNLPSVHQPGTKWNYSTGDIHLLSAILTEASSMSTRDFARKYLFGPIGIENFRWQKLGDGYYAGGSRLELKPVDMIKLGQLFANGGTVNGKRLISEEYTKAATSPQNPKGSFGNEEDGAGYGYAWWVGYYKGLHCYMASGYGGQAIIVVPELNLSVVATHNWLVNDQQAGKQQRICTTLAGFVIDIMLRER